MIDIEYAAKLIPLGHKNAKSLDEMVRIFCLNEVIDDEWSADYKRRQTRRIISRVGIDYTVCNLQDGYGYFRPTKEDKDAFRKWISQEEHRAKIIGRRLQKGKKLFEDYMKDRCDEQRMD